MTGEPWLFFIIRKQPTNDLLGFSTLKSVIINSSSLSSAFQLEIVFLKSDLTNSIIFGALCVQLKPEIEYVMLKNGVIVENCLPSQE